MQKIFKFILCNLPVAFLFKSFFLYLCYLCKGYLYSIFLFLKIPLIFYMMLIAKFTDSLSVSLNASGHFRRLDAYRSTLQSVFRFCGDESLSLKTLFTRRFLHDYEEFLTRSGRRRNTISFYMTTLRSIYNQAVEMKKLPYTHDLFSSVFTGTDPTKKRAVTPDTIAGIFAADLSAVPRLEVCRDYLLLAFQLQGMPFVDLAHLRKSDLQGSVISYRRQKTGGLVQVSVLPEAQAIFDKYAGQVKESPYLLPLITKSGIDGRRQYQSALHRQNRQLKELARFLHINENLTTYVARHSWATIAYHSGVEVGVVSQGMGHHTEEITRTYLSSFGQNRLMQANRLVLSTVLRPIAEGRIRSSRPEVKVRARQRIKELSHLFVSESQDLRSGTRSFKKRRWEASRSSSGGLF